ncbi:hypothetical protein QBC34DRAFT_224268 [Podospora aff. communis PSN243]|uniref:DUF7779 domain-containing protein n=1 Tax=Podospora aff. communis PSN243 TaxID=3040156 RepID=A0AAV9G075_9PEZI|nr:hypothetical protein QBC34DRAFT_224268 [Podospora aff. communis PSN243]
MPIGWRGPRCTRQSNKNFVGRNHLLAAIHKCIQDGPVEGEPTSCLLIGLAGIGKTEVALEYCYRQAKDYDYQFWVAAGSDAELSSSFGRVADLIPCPRGVSKDVVSDVVTWLETTDTSWMMVLDNAENWASVLPCLPQRCSARSAVIITSQLTAMAPMVHHTFNMGSLLVAEGAKLVEKLAHIDFTPTREDHDAALCLSKRFAGFPLMLAHIGGFINESAITIERHEQTFYARHAVGWSGMTYATARYGKPIETAWDFALGPDQMPENSRHLLMVMSFLDSDCIPESLLLESLKHDPASWGVEPGSEEAELLGMRKTLRKRSLISISRTSTHDASDAFSMQHSLQHAILVQLDKDPGRRSAVFHQASKVIRLATPKANKRQIPDPTFWPEFEVVIPHIVSLCRKFDQSVASMNGTLEFAKLLYDGGFYLWERQDYSATEDAVLILSTALGILNEVSYPAGGRLRADVLAIMGMCYDRRGPAFYGKALEIREQAWQIRQAIKEQEVKDRDVTSTTDTLLYNSINDLGIAEMQLNKFHQAEMRFTECLGKYQTWGPEKEYPFEYAKYYHNMGLVHMCRGVFMEAFKCLKRAVELEELQEKAKSSPLISLFEYHFACVVFHAGDAKKSLDMHLRIFRGRERMSGKSSETTLLSCYTVGAMYHYLGDLNRAEQYIKDCIDRANSVDCGLWPDYARGRAHLHLANLMRARSAPDEEIQPIDEIGRAILAKYKDIVQPLYPMIHDDMTVYDALQPALHGRYSGQGLVPLLQRMPTVSTEQ